jgi:hypothetical protein
MVGRSCRGRLACADPTVPPGGLEEPMTPGVHIVGRLEPGAHTVSIGGVADHCAVDGNATRTATVTARTVNPLRFTVTCQAVTGAIEITAVTSGEDIDLDGYHARVEGAASHVVDANGTAILTKLAPGPHIVRLEQIATNCQGPGAAEQQAVVSAGATTRITFQLTCARTYRIAFTRGEDDQVRIGLARLHDAGVDLVLAGQDPAWSPDGRRLLFRRMACEDDAWYGGYGCGAIGLFIANIDGSYPVQLTAANDGPSDWSRPPGRLSWRY